jgi:hypothetical protein
MRRTRRFIAVLVLTGLITLAFIGGSLTSASSLAPQVRTSGQINLTPNEWAAVQAGNSVLTNGFSTVIYLPLAVKE